MANIKVSEMTEATEFDDLDYAMIVQTNQNKKIVKDNLFKDVTNSINDINTSIQNLETDINVLQNNGIVEQGSNYIKYSSGKMIQWGKTIVSDAIQTPMGSMYRPVNVQNVAFSQEFYDTTTIINLTTQAALNFAYVGSTPTKTGFAFWPIGLVSSAAANRYVFWTAIGRWKEEE